jgi:hypothetical protein
MTRSSPLTARTRLRDGDSAALDLFGPRLVAKRTTALELVVVLGSEGRRFGQIDETFDPFVDGEHDGLSRCDSQDPRCDALVERADALITEEIGGDGSEP